MMTPLQPGDLAPDAALKKIDGTPVRLSDYWKQQPTLIVFLRHYGCIFCREHLYDLEKEYAALKASGVQVIAIGQGTPEQTGEFCAGRGFSFDVLSDSGSSTYAAYGLGNGTLNQLFGAAVWMRGVEAVFKGHFIGKLVGNGFQMPGVFAVGTDGRITAAHYFEHAGDIPDAVEMAQSASDVETKWVIDVFPK